MDIIDTLSILTRNNKIKWNKFNENVYVSKVENIKIEVYKDIIENEHDLEYLFSITVKAPDKTLEIIKTPQYKIEELYMIIDEFFNGSSISILNETLKKMMEKN